MRGGKEGHNRGFKVQSNPVNTDTKEATESIRNVRIRRIEFRENVRAFFPPGTRKTVRINGVSVKRGPSLIFDILFFLFFYRVHFTCC